MYKYKYYSTAKHNLEAVEHQYFWFSTHEGLNDPFDMAGDFFKRFPNFGGTIVNSAWKRKYEIATKRYGICCFTSNPLNRHFWSLYADSYKGFVLCFDDTNFHDDLSLRLLAKTIYEDCIYLDGYPDFSDNSTVIPFNEVETRTIDEILESHDPRQIDRIFEYYLYIKDKNVWKVENESRLLLGQSFINNIDNKIPQTLNSIFKLESNGYGIKWPVSCLKEIYFGPRIDPQVKSRLNSILPSDVIRKSVYVNNTCDVFALGAERES